VTRVLIEVDVPIETPQPVIFNKSLAY
jgi:hypothetical protein